MKVDASRHFSDHKAVKDAKLRAWMTPCLADWFSPGAFKRPPPYGTVRRSGSGPEDGGLRVGGQDSPRHVLLEKHPVPPIGCEGNSAA